jgi:preprotein translocase subunit Sec61beta
MASGPQTQAGIFNFYDAPDSGPDINVRTFLIIIVIFAIIVLIFDHFLAFPLK